MVVVASLVLVVEELTAVPSQGLLHCIIINSIMVGLPHPMADNNKLRARSGVVVRERQERPRAVLVVLLAQAEVLAGLEERTIMVVQAVRPVGDIVSVSCTHDVSPSDSMRSLSSSRNHPLLSAPLRIAS